VCKKLIKNSQLFGKKFQKTTGGIFLTHTVELTHYKALNVAAAAAVEPMTTKC